MKKGKSNFFLIAPFALWGCISVWTSNLVRLTDKSAVPYDFYDVGTYLDCSVGCYFGVVGSSKPIYWSATTQVTIPKL